jgi:hypothetical protein
MRLMNQHFAYCSLSLVNVCKCHHHMQAKVEEVIVRVHLLFFFFCVVKFFHAHIMNGVRLSVMSSTTCATPYETNL